MREGPRDKPLAADVMLTGGSFGFLSAMTRLGGTVGKTTYTALYQHRQASGWRPNSNFSQHLGYAALSQQLGQRVRIKADATIMTYLAHQPGGLTDRQFALDAQSSLRQRNWFGVNWLLASLTADWVIDTSTSLRTMFFVNSSSRVALGNLDRINMIDLGGDRTMIDGLFRNIGNETTLQHDLTVAGFDVSFLGGVRLFSGTTTQRQGTASDGSDADFRFVGRGLRDGSEFTFPNANAALFAEAVISVSDRLRIVPGVRLEHIGTRADGYYGLSLRDLAGNLIVDSLVSESRRRDRTIALVGLGLSYKLNSLEFYANVTRNYRSITFSDLRIVNPNLVVDPNISDERGATVDLGLRGTVEDIMTLDASIFYLRYNNKIGEVLRSDQAPLYLPYRYRTNVGDAYTAGIEAMTEISLTRLAGASVETAIADVHVLLNGSVTRGRYLSPNDPTIDGKTVEYVPDVVLRSGLIVRAGMLRGSFLVSTTGKQFTDATNAEFSSSAVSGVLGAYTVADLTVSYSMSPVTIEATMNNVFDTRYATRRAESYPGPGLIPAEPRSFFLGIRLSL
jgi:Fe(3+) dicitrate transport protein